MGAVVSILVASQKGRYNFFGCTYSVAFLLHGVIAKTITFIYFSRGVGLVDVPRAVVLRFGARLQWYLLKLPLTVVLIVVGFLFEAVICWPFALLCWLHGRRSPR